MSEALPDLSRATLGDIAEARAALKVAERLARERAAADRQRAAAEAEQAAADAFQAEVDAHLGPWEPVTAAEARRQVLQDQRSRLIDQRASVAAELGAARGMPAVLVERALGGEDVTQEEVDQAYAAITAAERFDGHLSAVIAHLAPRIAAAEAEVKAAIAEAYRPVFDRGVDYRIEAAMALDAVRTNVPSLDDPSARDAAWRTFEHGNALMRLALDKGLRCPSASGFVTSWPTTERAERRTWRRPAPEAAP